jgi:tetratricopeptide (TPR) repeat protein
MSDNSDPGQENRTSRIVQSSDFAEWLLMPIAIGALLWLLARTPKSLDDLRKLAINVLVLAATGLTGFTVYRAFDERLAIIEPITFPKSLEEQSGYTSAIVARRLMDQVEHINATARTRVARVKVGQESQFASLSSLQVPSSGLTLQTFVSLLRTVFGRQDERIGGEITTKQSDERPSQTVYRMLLRFDIERDTEYRFGRPTDSRRFVKVIESPKLDDLVERSAQAIVENTAPTVLASYHYGARNWKDLDKLLDQLVESAKPNIKRQASTLRGMRLLEKCDLKGALEFLETAVNLGDDSAFARIKYGDALVKANRPDKAIKEFERALELEAGALAYSSWAKALVRQNKQDDALKLLEKAQAQPSVGKDPRIYRTWGDILSEKRMYKEAADRYRIAVALDPESWTAYDHWGTALRADGDLAGAIEKFRLAIETDGRAPEPHYHLFDALLHQQDVSGMTKAFRYAANVIKEHSVQLSAMADDLARKPNLPTASEMLKTVMKIAPKACVFSLPVMEQEASR